MPPGPLPHLLPAHQCPARHPESCPRDWPQDECPGQAPGHAPEDYAFARPELVTYKRNKLELAAGAPSQRGNHRQPGAAYEDKHRRHKEIAAAERAEHAHQVLVAQWLTLVMLALKVLTAK
jgi:hypothetical protein